MPLTIGHTVLGVMLQAEVHGWSSLGIQTWTLGIFALCRAPVNLSYVDLCLSFCQYLAVLITVAYIRF